MSAEDLKALVATRMQQAAECISDGRFLLAAGRGPRTAINRAYYAAFYTVLALLQTIGKTPRKHSGVLSLFDAEFVKSGLLAKELSFDLHRLFDTRQEDDYQRLDPISQEEATEALDLAEGFVQTVRRYLTEQEYLPGP